MIGTRWWLSVALLALGGVAAQAADVPGGVSLLRPDSLAGWTHGSPAPSGWSISGARLSGSAASTPLLSGWTFGDVQLDWQWSVARGGACKVLLPAVPKGAGLEIVLDEGAQCGRVLEGDTLLAKGTRITPAADGMHKASLQRAGQRLTLSVDGQKVSSVALPAGSRFGLGLAVGAGEATIAELRMREPAGKSLFNGKNLRGWWTPGDIEAWDVREGEIAWIKRGGSYLRSLKEFGNFTLSCEYKVAKGGNSGVGVRTPRLGWPSADGMEMQTWDKPYDVPLDKHQTMAIYGHVPPLARADRSEEWNRVVIKADGYMISAWVNGELVQQYNTFHHPELKYRHLRGWVGFQDHTDGVAFRKVFLLEAPEGLGLEAWYAPQARNIGMVVVDRLMNSETLATRDGIVSGVASKTIRVEVKRESSPAKKPEAKGAKPATAAPPAAAKAAELEVRKPAAKAEVQKATAEKSAEDKKAGPAARPARGAEPTAAKPAATESPAAAKKAPEVKGPGTPQAQTRQDKLDQPPAAQAPEAKTQPGKGAKTPSAKSSPEAKPPKAKPPKAAPKELPRKAGDEVLAELVGPGVVVRMARSGGDGQLAFYFDGESQPRLECPAAELHKFVPELCEDVNPVLTCLAYRKSLKIVVRRPTAGQYRIEYLSLPAELAAESFRDRETGLSPSWLSAVRFRYHQHKGGVVRDYDPAPRQTAEPIQLPGGGELSVAAPGAGCVQWVRLLAARKVLENPDLWLEAWVDGEAQPAVSAPARFWFPAFVGGNNYANFVLADKNGITNRLAMPFGQGIKFRAVNRGAKPIDAVGLSISVLLAARHDAATDASRMRLRGVFLPQNTSDVEQPAEWFALRGPGRWVGLVYQQPDRQALGIAQVWIDQQPRAEWAAGGLDAWLGLGVKDFRTALTGRRSGLCWSYLLLAPVDFQESLRVQATGQKLGDRLVLYYAP